MEFLAYCDEDFFLLSSLSNSRKKSFCAPPKIVYTPPPPLVTLLCRRACFAMLKNNNNCHSCFQNFMKHFITPSVTHFKCTRKKHYDKTSLSFFFVSFVKQFRKLTELVFPREELVALRPHQSKEKPLALVLCRNAASQEMRW